MLESYIESQGNKSAKRNGWSHRKVRWIGRRAAPDRLYMKPGVGIFFVEYKKPGEKPRPDQVREIELIRSCGVTVHVIDNVEDAVALFEEDGCTLLG